MAPAPARSARAVADQWGLIRRSSNYELYGDLSTRVMQQLGRYTAWQEIYSIDESFLGLNGTPEELVERGRQMKEAVASHVGLPVCVGIAPTKTLAKFANRIAKQNPNLGGVCNLETMPPDDVDRIMSRVPVTGIWGVAGRLGKRLNALGIFTIADLRAADPVMIRKKFSVVFQRCSSCGAFPAFRSRRATRTRSRPFSPGASPSRSPPRSACTRS
ncbi:hypothetical protein [Arthrobacter sp. VKM Ac-2550]|uniref:Y-family DNA polymerase n=1 Tax=Crystallibacter permensis TaxID=1938888 RepID=UPI002227E409|nr:hypothetical protein [Arthrobacter sp. VKM Ac-2550]